MTVIILEFTCYFYAFRVEESYAGVTNNNVFQKNSSRNQDNCISNTKFWTSFEVNYYQTTFQWKCILNGTLLSSMSTMDIHIMNFQSIQYNRWLHEMQYNHWCVHCASYQFRSSRRPKMFPRLDFCFHLNGRMPPFSSCMYSKIIRFDVDRQFGRMEIISIHSMCTENGTDMIMTSRYCWLDVHNAHCVNSIRIQRYR